jgi:hypothetical protein
MRPTSKKSGELKNETGALHFDRILRVDLHRASATRKFYEHK